MLGNTIAAWLKTAIAEIESRGVIVTNIVTDFGSNFTVAIRQLTDVIVVPCHAHLFNLLGKDLAHVSTEAAERGCVEFLVNTFAQVEAYVKSLPRDD